MERIQKEHQPRRSREPEPVSEVKADTKDGVKAATDELLDEIDDILGEMEQLGFSANAYVQKGGE